MKEEERKHHYLMAECIITFWGFHMNSLVTSCCPLAFGAFVPTLSSFLSFSYVLEVLH